MKSATDSSWAPWIVTSSKEKKRARLNVISHLLKHMPYGNFPVKKVPVQKWRIKRRGAGCRYKYVPEHLPAASEQG